MKNKITVKGKDEKRIVINSVIPKGYDDNESAFERQMKEVKEQFIHLNISEVLLDNKKRVNRLLESMKDVVMKIEYDNLHYKRKVRFLVGYNKPYEFYKEVYLENDDYILKDQEIIMVELKAAINIHEKLYQTDNWRWETS
jgi:hypothetical protein